MRKLNAIDHIVFQNAKKMDEIEDGSARLVIFNPPRVGMNGSAKQRRGKERLFMVPILIESMRVCSPGGVIACVLTDFEDNVRHGIFMELAQELGLYCQDQKIWIRGFGVNVTPKKHFSHILVYSKTQHIRKRNRTNAYLEEPWIFTQSQIFEDFDAAMAFEVPERLIAEFTNKGDLVVAPFAGIGTEVIVALHAERDAVGYEINPDRREDIEAREEQFLHQIELARSGVV